MIARGDPGYEAARKVYNAMIDRHPRVIVQCADVADVRAALAWARQNGALTAVRSGGHNGAGLGVCDDGLVIDLSPMKGVRVDPETRTVRVGGGCVWGDVDHATHAFGMATPSGFISTTGVGGLTLGGGIGYLTRSHGLTIDNLVSADVILADGRWVVASADENPDLFWAIRGGGGNFGVVTSFVFRMHPVDMVQAGPTFWPLDRTPEIMRAYAQFIATAPEDVGGFFALMTIPPIPLFPESLHGKKVCGVMWCCTASAERTEAATRPLRSLGGPVFDYVGTMPFPVVQSFFDGLMPPGLQWYWRAHFIRELSDEAIRLHLEYGRRLPTPLSTTHFYPINGAAHRVGKNDTAFSYRDATFAQVIAGIDPDPANAPAITAWSKSYFDALLPHSEVGAYVNFLMDEGQDRVKASFRDNYERLAAIKKKYDPSNFFRVNQNIRPA